MALADGRARPRRASGPPAHVRLRPALVRRRDPAVHRQGGPGRHRGPVPVARGRQRRLWITAGSGPARGVAGARDARARFGRGIGPAFPRRRWHGSDDRVRLAAGPDRRHDPAAAARQGDRRPATEHARSAAQGRAVDRRRRCTVVIERLLDAERAMSFGQIDLAQGIYEQVSTSDPKNSIAVVGLARVALERGDELGAYLLARRALGIDPENDAARRMAVRLEEVLATRGHPVDDPLPADEAHGSVSDAAPAPPVPHSGPATAAPTAERSAAPESGAHVP